MPGAPHEIDEVESRNEDEQTRAASLSSVDPKDFTVEATFSTGAAVRRYSWRRDEEYWEELEISDAAINRERLEKGVPIYDNHMSYGGARAVLGRSAPGTFRVVNDRDARAKLRFDGEDENARFVFGKIERKFIGEVSVGYRIDKLVRTDEMRDGIPVYRATRWTPLEISPVGMPADVGAAIRAAQAAQKRNNQIMPAPAPVENAPAPAPVLPPTPVAPAAVVPGASPAERAEIARAERQRIATLTERCSKLNLPETFARGLVDQGVSVEDARELILAEVEARAAVPPPAPPAKVRGVGVTAQMVTDESDTRAAVLADSFALRLMLSNDSEKIFDSPEQYREAQKNKDFATPIKLARFVLVERGGYSLQQLEGMRSAEIIKTAMAVRSTLTTSDYPLLLESGVRRSLRGYYNAIEQPWKQFSVKDNAADFRPRTIVSHSGLGLPQKVAQGQEYGRTSFNESGETWSIEHEGQILGFSMQALVNDDLGALRIVPQNLGRSAANAECRDFWTYVFSTPLMGDGVALFHASRGNIAAGSLANSTALETAYQWMWRREDSMGNIIGAKPGFLVTSSTLKIKANVLFESQVLPATLADTIAVRAEGIERPKVLADAWIDKIGTTSNHLLVADASVGSAFVYGYLEGAEGPQIETQTNFKTSGIDFKLMANFGVKAVDANLVYLFT